MKSSIYGFDDAEPKIELPKGTIKIALVGLALTVTWWGVIVFAIAFAGAYAWKMVAA